MATVASLPRTDWPAQIVWYDARGRWVKQRFEYASDAPCKLPIALQVDGIVGCPTRSVQTHENGEVLEETWTYDDRRRIQIDKRFRWSGDLVGGMYTSPEFRIFEGASGPNLALAQTTDDGIMDLYRVEAGRAVAHYVGWASGEAPAKLTPDIELTWSPTRLLGIKRKSDKGYLEYAGTPAPERAETVARRQRETADQDVAKLGTVESVPRRDWPCARVVKWDDGDTTRSSLQYDPAIARCVMPILKLTAGLPGCEVNVSEVRVQPDGTRTEDQASQRYDGDHVQARRRIDGLFDAPQNGAFERTASGLKVSDGSNSTAIDLVDGNPVRVTKTAARGLEVTNTLTWKGRRIQSIDTRSFADQHSITTFEYDCEAPAPGPAP